MKNKKQFSLIFIVAIIAALVGCAKKETPITETKPVLFEEKIKFVTEIYKIPEKDIKWDKLPIEIKFPKSKLIEEFVAELFAVTDDTEYKIIESMHFTKKRPEYVSVIFENKKNEQISLKIILTNEQITRMTNVKFLIKNLEKLSVENANLLIESEEPLNYILTPFDSIAQVFSKLEEQQVLLEIPIEENKTNERETRFADKKYTIKLSDNKNSINGKIKLITSFYPNTVGLYAKTGSLILNSKENARNFLLELKTKKRNLAFFDDRPKVLNKNEVCKEISDELGVLYGTISISLPSKQNLTEEEWETELMNAIDRVAKNRNSVILISADNNFVKVFDKKLTDIKNKGIEFVPITH